LQKNKILITGGAGYVGSNLEKFLKKKNFMIYCLDILPKIKKNYFQINIVNKKQVLNFLKKIKPDIIIHTAGLSNLKICEENKKLAYQINIQGTKNLISAIKNIDQKIKLVFFSSDYVFDGINGNYKENSIQKPRTEYGKNKLQSEKDIKDNLNNYIILRTANIFGHNGGNFFNFVVKNLLENKKIEVFNDVFYTPTYIDYLLDSIYYLLQNDFNGTIHIAGAETISRYQFAKKIACSLKINPRLIKPIKQGNGLISKNVSLNSSYSRKIIKNYYPSIDKSLHHNFLNLQYPYFYFEDQRGKILGLLQTGNWKEINYIESQKKCIRGNHYHKRTKEAFFIIDGKIKVILKDLKNNKTKIFYVQKGDIFIVNKYVLHTFEIIKNASWINMLSKPMNENDKDIHRI
jgi:dTDP-4-dehydrorhamnose reductase